MTGVALMLLLWAAVSTLLWLEARATIADDARALDALQETIDEQQELVDAYRRMEIVSTGGAS
jgi:hypothetical protein